MFSSKNSNNKLFIRFIRSYILIFFVPLVISIQAFRIASDIVTNDIKQSNLSMLNQAKKIIDFQHQEIETLSMQIACNSNINDFITLQEPLKNSTFNDFSDILDELSKYLINSDIVEYLYIYSRNIPYVLMPDTVYPSDIFYDKVLRYNTNEYSAWREMILGNYYNGEYIATEFNLSKDSDKNYFRYIQSLPLGYKKENSSGVLVLILKKECLTNLFSNIDLSNGGCAYIQDKNGNIIANVPQDNKEYKFENIDEFKNKEGFIKHSFSNDKMIITYTTSELNGWKYVIALPSSVVLEKLNNFNNICWLIFFTALIIGTLIASLMAYRNSKPLSVIINKLKEVGRENISKNVDALSFINGSLSRLIENNEVLRTSIDRQKPIAHSAFINKLFKGEIYSISELKAISSYIGVEIEGDRYVVLLIKIFYNDSVEMILSSEVAEELNISKALVREVLNSNLDHNNIILHDVNHHTIAILISTYSKDDKKFLNDIEIMMNKVQEQLKNEYNMKVLISGGEVYNNILNTWRSFEQAEVVLKNNVVNSDTVIWYTNIPRESESFHYPLDYEQKLINYIRIGGKEQVKNLLTLIYEENFNVRNLSFNMSRDLLYELRGTLIRSIVQLAAESEIKEGLYQFKDTNSVSRNFNVLEELYMKTCELMKIEMCNKNVDLVVNIKEYIENNYNDQDMCLYKVSSQFNLSESYFSYLFKDITNINFTEYLEKIRMEHSYKLLKNSNFSINDISGKVGYNSPQSFRRAFKRYHGITPSELRNI